VPGASLSPSFCTAFRAVHSLICFLLSLDGEDDEMSDIELSKKAIGEKLDAAMACLNQVVKTERIIGLSRTKGNRRDGWSAKYAKVIADVTELVAVANEACGANVAKLKELMSGVDELEKQRPLKLQEALKKITIGIRKNRMAKLWHKLGVCDESQYAFLRGRSTIQPAMIKRLLLERAKFYNLPMIVLRT
jgi:hypothetical protein